MSRGSSRPHFDGRWLLVFFSPINHFIPRPQSLRSCRLLQLLALSTHPCVLLHREIKTLRGASFTASQAWTPAPAALMPWAQTPVRGAAFPAERGAPGGPVPWTPSPGPSISSDQSTCFGIFTERMNDSCLLVGGYYYLRLQLKEILSERLTALPRLPFQEGQN